jgi:hypothetical protein
VAIAGQPEANRHRFFLATMAALRASYSLGARQGERKMKQGFSSLKRVMVSPVVLVMLMALSMGQAPALEPKGLLSTCHGRCARGNGQAGGEVTEAVGPEKSNGGG